MRGTLAGLETPRRFVDALPALYQEDDFTQRFTTALDDILAPVLSTIDNLPAYLDPAVTPDDFLEWLGGWVAALLDETWPLERRRAFVARATDLHRRRGTAAGLADHVRIFTGGEVEIVESGGAAWSPTSGAAIPGTNEPRLHVRVTVRHAGDIDPEKLDALIAGAKPAHLGHTVEIAVARPAGGGS